MRIFALGAQALHLPFDAPQHSLYNPLFPELQARGTLAPAEFS